MSSSNQTTFSAPAAAAGTEAVNNYFDADFSVDINNKMRVPDRIKLSSASPAESGSMVNGELRRSESDVLEDPAIIAVKKQASDDAQWMRVPERICVVGGEAHMSTREPPPELKLEHSFLGKPSDYEQIVQLTTPPRTLRIEDTAPAFEPTPPPHQQLDKALKSIDNSNNRSLINRSSMNDSMFAEFGDDSELISSQSYLQIRRRLVQISQRLDSLEMENNRRSKRELFLYTLGVILVLFRGVTWFSARNDFRL